MVYFCVRFLNNTIYIYIYMQIHMYIHRSCQRRNWEGAREQSPPPRRPRGDVAPPLILAISQNKPPSIQASILGNFYSKENFPIIKDVIMILTTLKICNFMLIFQIIMGDHGPQDHRKRWRGYMTPPHTKFASCTSGSCFDFSKWFIFTDVHMSIHEIKALRKLCYAS